MNNEDFWEWMSTCPTDRYIVDQHDSDYCRIIFPLIYEEEEDDNE